MKNMSSRKLWGGRFSSKQDEILEAFAESFSFDQRLWKQDLAVLKAHVGMLSKQQILQKAMASKILSALEEIQTEIENGRLPLSGGHEDIHSFIEEALVSRLGEEASAVRIGRSRNDTVVTDLRLFLKDEALKIRKLHHDYLSAFIRLGERYKNWVVPGYTHARKAQPILFPFYTLAQFSQGVRERESLDLALGWSDVSTLGAGALAGTTWPINPELTARQLGFSTSFFNALDAVSDRDFLLAFYFASSLIFTHISRWCEDFIFWSSEGPAYLHLPDALCTGSSLMPQKKNPDPLELLRGKTGRMVGNLFGLFMVMKGLPTGYNRDLQEDKEPLFYSVNVLQQSLLMAVKILDGLSLSKEALTRLWKDDFSLATDLADELVKRGFSFSKAHALAGKTVQYCDEKGKGIKDLSPSEWEKLVPGMNGHAFPNLSVEQSAKGRESKGGTGEKAVERALTDAKVWLKKNKPKE